MPNIILDIDDPAGRLPAGCEEKIKTCLARALELNGVERAAACLSAVDGEEIRRLNREYRHTDRETDVLSFPLVPFTPQKTAKDAPGLLSSAYDPAFDAPFLGDIVLNPSRAREQAEEYGHSFEREVCYLCVHSLLHLMGYDHMDETDKKAMREMEKRVMGDESD